MHVNPQVIDPMSLHLIDNISTHNKQTLYISKLFNFHKNDNNGDSILRTKVLYMERRRTSPKWVWSCKYIHICGSWHIFLYWLSWICSPD